MTFKLKRLGLALVVAFALSAVSASTASALFHSNVGTTYLTFSQIGTNTLDTEVGNVKCKTVGGTGTFFGKEVFEAEISPTYGECTAFGLEAKIDMNGCIYRTHSVGTFTLSCPGFSMQITVNPASLVCTISMWTQGVSATFTNEGTSPTRDVKVTPSPIGPLTYEVKYPKGETEGKCGKAGSHSNGHFTGSTTLKAYKNFFHTEQADYWYE